MTQPPADEPGTSTPQTADDASDVDVEGALKSLADLADRGVITPEEYAFKKAEWLEKYGPLPGH